MIQPLQDYDHSMQFLINDNTLKEAIAQRKALFFGGISRYTPPSKVQQIFFEEFGPVEILFLEERPVPDSPPSRYELHLGRGFVIFTEAKQLEGLTNPKYLSIEGILVKIRVALTKSQTKARQRRVRANNLKLYLSGFSPQIPYKYVRDALRHLGDIAEISYLRGPFVKQACCYAIFTNQDTVKQWDNRQILLMPGVHAFLSISYASLEPQKPIDINLGLGKANFYKKTGSILINSGKDNYSLQDIRKYPEHVLLRLNRADNFRMIL